MGISDIHVTMEPILGSAKIVLISGMALHPCFLQAGCTVLFQNRARTRIVP